MPIFVQIDTVLNTALSMFHVVLSRHFTTIGCHDHLSLAMVAIDSLRQLSVKFLLEKHELRDFNFQRLFLTPFEVIMANATHVEIRALVITCMEQMVQTRGEYLKSGWKTIWNVLHIAAESAVSEAEASSSSSSSSLHTDENEHGHSILQKNKDKWTSEEMQVVSMGFSVARLILESHFHCVV
jgi:Sec7-like guanine-nucleotide exchange factor